MDNSIFKGIVTRMVKESFPGTETTQESSGGQTKNVIYVDNKTKIKILLPSGDKSVVLSRSQQFKKLERTFLDKFVDQLYLLIDLNSELIPVISEKLQSRVIAQCLGQSDKVTNHLIEAINILETWASETYEGNSISAGFIVNPSSDESSGVKFADYTSTNFSKVLTNGYDTAVEFSSHGHLTKYIHVDKMDKDNWKCPFRYTGISSLTLNDKKIALVLNRNGEILVFQSNELKFARRRGSWSTFTHDTVVEKMSFGSRYRPKAMRQTIYSSALDVSFARCGGTIAYFNKSKLEDGKAMVYGDTLPDEYNDIKEDSLSMFIEASFSNIDRRIKQEMIGIDGATILDHDGNLIFTGAIVEVNPERGEGGRTAAAKRLSDFGISLKISEDGKISVFKSGKREFVFA